MVGRRAGVGRGLLRWIQALYKTLGVKQAYADPLILGLLCPPSVGILSIDLGPFLDTFFLSPPTFAWEATCLGPSAPSVARQ